MVSSEVNYVGIEIRGRERKLEGIKRRVVQAMQVLLHSLASQ